jgi:hypothetical protein
MHQRRWVGGSRCALQPFRLCCATGHRNGEKGEQCWTGQSFQLRLKCVQQRIDITPSWDSTNVTLLQQVTGRASVFISALGCQSVSLRCPFFSALSLCWAICLSLKSRNIVVLTEINLSVDVTDSLCGLVVRVPGCTTEMYCVSCEVRTEFIYVM